MRVLDIYSCERFHKLFSCMYTGNIAAGEKERCLMMIITIMMFIIMFGTLLIPPTLNYAVCCLRIKYYLFIYGFVCI